ncbi:FkbM family methyltransferase [Roseococcus sp. SDR]|uniref:FkbM family methyltransferase n=1 Tax=Roseococcus sp. SDR TaxID=2835532 RepID=UPI001BCCF479|nr:FkbM family methyltransferase [Roseococcus sp. SDR]MBS7791920.1 FkbM family methyltransferase [Roseococcus sp. SDR]MBV1847234.1 FkbM family methyltransferase [Roseococcus sp. SDR]
MAHNAVLDLLMRGGYRTDCVFDVGASSGLTAREFAHVFPDAAIHAFEPVKLTFDMLRKACAAQPAIRCNRLALGRTPGEVTMAVAGASTGNRVLLPGTFTKGETEVVEQTTGDIYCQQNGIERIGFLKIDTEGRDLDVLIGFSAMVQAQRIDFVQMECGLSPENLLHVPLTTMQAVLFAFGYRMYGLFDLMPRKRSGLAAAFYGNAVYVRPDLAWPPVPQPG